MRGSVYYQSAQLVKIIFQEGAKKTQRNDPEHPYYQKIASFKTMESYRSIWNNFFNYLKEHWQIKDCTKIEPEHIAAYIDYKIEYYPSRLYLNKIVSALGKLEIALNMYSKEYEDIITYDFSIREEIKKSAVDLKLVANNYHNRAYKNPKRLISYISGNMHKLAATIQFEGGARIEGVGLIKKEQLFGYIFDEITNTNKGVVFTKEKGGKEGKILIALNTYGKLKEYIDNNGSFKFKKQQYYKDIRQACQMSNENSEGSHGFRWNFAQHRLFEYAQAGYSYEESLLKVSSEMKHNRAKITEHYLCT